MPLLVAPLVFLAGALGGVFGQQAITNEFTSSGSSSNSSLPSGVTVIEYGVGAVLLYHVFRRFVK